MKQIGNATVRRRTKEIQSKHRRRVRTIFENGLFIHSSRTIDVSIADLTEIETLKALLNRSRGETKIRMGLITSPRDKERSIGEIIVKCSLKCPSGNQTQLVVLIRSIWTVPFSIIDPISFETLSRLTSELIFGTDPPSLTFEKSFVFSPWEIRESVTMRNGRKVPDLSPISFLLVDVDDCSMY